MKKKAALIVLIPLMAASLFSYSSKLEEKMFFAMGNFGAAFLYQTYLNIGMVSDVWTNSTYTPEDAKSLLNTNLSFLKTSIKIVRELTDFSIAAEDRATFLEMISIMDDLTVEAESLLAYMADRAQKDLERYETHRKQAWAKIAKLMDIE